MQRTRDPNYDKLAPTNLVTVQNPPSAVRMRWVVPASLSTQAASSAAVVVNPGWMVSKTFFLGLSTSSGVASERGEVEHNGGIKGQKRRECARMTDLGGEPEEEREDD